MKQTRKTLTLILVLLLALAMLAACGKDGGAKPTPEPKSTPKPTPQATAEPTPEPTPEPTDDGIGGKTAEWNGYTLFVPDGFEIKEPGEFSYYDISVQKSEFAFIYFITEDDNEMMMEKYNYNKETYTNEQEDVEAVYGANTWTGFQYSDGWGGYGFEVYTTLGEKIVRVSSCGFRFDSPVAEAVLSAFAPK